jgi:Mrp family chromosome partitioning ATPase
LASQTLAEGGGQIVQQASAPTSPTSPNPSRDAAVALVLGAVVAVGYAFLNEHLGRRVYTREDAISAARVPVLATLPAGRPWRPRTRSSDADGPRTDERAYEASRELRSALIARGLGETVGSLLIFSAEPRQGATSTVVDLGVACANAGMRTVLVAADLRDRYVDSLFGSDQQPGLIDVLTSGGGMREALRKVVGKTEVNNLTLLPGGIADNGTRDPLASPRLALVLRELCRSANVVLIASPPLSEGADASILARHADAAVLAVRTRSARTSAIRHAAGILEDLHVPLIGLVLRDVGPLGEGSKVALPSSEPVEGSSVAPLSSEPVEDPSVAPASPADTGELHPRRRIHPDDVAEPQIQGDEGPEPELHDEDVPEPQQDPQPEDLVVDWNFPSLLPPAREEKEDAEPRRDLVPRIATQDAPPSGNGSERAGERRPN